MGVGRFFSRVVPVAITLLLAPNFLAAAPPKGESADAEVQFKMGVGYFRAGEPAEAVRWLERAAKSNIPILVTGESGVGKELVARAIAQQVTSLLPDQTGQVMLATSNPGKVFRLSRAIFRR